MRNGDTKGNMGMCGHNLPPRPHSLNTEAWAGGLRAAPSLGAEWAQPSPSDRVSEGGRKGMGGSRAQKGLLIPQEGRFGVFGSPRPGQAESKPKLAGFCGPEHLQGLEKAMGAWHQGSWAAPLQTRPLILPPICLTLPWLIS